MKLETCGLAFLAVNSVQVRGKNYPIIWDKKNHLKTSLPLLLSQGFPVCWRFHQETNPADSSGAGGTRDAARISESFLGQALVLCAQEMAPITRNERSGTLCHPVS